MHHADAVSIVERVGNVGNQFSRLAERRPLPAQPFVERHAVHERRNDVRLAVGVTDFEQRHDAGMAQLGRRLRLAPEAFRPLRAAHLFGARHLAGHHAVQPRVVGLADRAECTTPAFAQQLEWTQPPHPLRRRGRARGKAPARVEQGAARRTCRLARAVDHFDRQMTVRARESHGMPPGRVAGWLLWHKL